MDRPNPRDWVNNGPELNRALDGMVTGDGRSSGHAFMKHGAEMGLQTPKAFRDAAKASVARAAKGEMLTQNGTSRLLLNDSQSGRVVWLNTKDPGKSTMFSKGNAERYLRDQRAIHKALGPNNQQSLDLPQLRREGHTIARQRPDSPKGGSSDPAKPVPPSAARLPTPPRPALKPSPLAKPNATPLPASPKPPQPRGPQPPPEPPRPPRR